MNSLYTQALIGGIFIGISALILMGGLGRIMGIGGILKSILPKRESGLWRYLFLIGIPLGVLIYSLSHPNYTITYQENNLIIAAISGILVGVGTSMANGCTSGHSVCGIGRFSLRSGVATLLFILSGIITVFITHHLI